MIKHRKNAIYYTEYLSIKVRITLNPLINN